MTEAQGPWQGAAWFEAAKALAERGFAVIGLFGPDAKVGTPGKQPETLEAWTPTIKGTRDINELKAMSERHTSPMNIGVVGGAPSGNLVFLDIDHIDQTIRAARIMLIMLSLRFGDTFEVETGAGVHDYYRTDVPVPSKAIDTKGTMEKLVKYGLFDQETAKPYTMKKNLLDFRSEGEFVVAPGSKHPTGKFYKGNDRPIVAIPAADLEHIQSLFERCWPLLELVKPEIVSGNWTNGGAAFASWCKMHEMPQGDAEFLADVLSMMDTLDSGTSFDDKLRAQVRAVYRKEFKTPSGILHKKDGGGFSEQLVSKLEMLESRHPMLGRRRTQPQSASEPKPAPVDDLAEVPSILENTHTQMLEDVRAQQGGYEHQEMPEVVPEPETQEKPKKGKKAKKPKGEKEESPVDATLEILIDTFSEFPIRAEPFINHEGERDVIIALPDGGLHTLDEVFPDLDERTAEEVRKRFILDLMGGDPDAWMLPTDPRDVVVGDVFGDIENLFRRFYHTRNPKEYEVLTTKVIASFLVPFLPFNVRTLLVGVTGGGKSLLVDLFRLLGYRSIQSDTATEAATRRMMHKTNGTILYDEYVHLTKPEKDSLNKIIPAGFNITATTRRTKMDGSGDVEAHHVGYSPLVIGSRIAFKEPDFINKSTVLTCEGITLEEAKKIITGLEYYDSVRRGLNVFFELKPELIELFDQMQSIRTRLYAYRLKLLAGDIKPMKVTIDGMDDVSRRIGNIYETLAPIPRQFNNRDPEFLKDFIHEEVEVIKMERESDIEGRLFSAIKTVLTLVKPIKVDGFPESYYISSSQIKEQVNADGLMTEDSRDINAVTVGKILSRILGLRPERFPREVNPFRSRGFIVPVDKVEPIIARLQEVLIGRDASTEIREPSNTRRTSDDTERRDGSSGMEGEISRPRTSATSGAESTGDLAQPAATDIPAPSPKPKRGTKKQALDIRTETFQKLCESGLQFIMLAADAGQRRWPADELRATIMSLYRVPPGANITWEEVLAKLPLKSEGNELVYTGGGA